MKRELKSLRALMKKNGIDIFLHFNTDPFKSEYVGDHDRGIRFLTGFSGSNASVVVTKDEAGLWTDGRYFTQAERELKGSGFKLYKMAVAGEPTLTGFVASRIKKGTVIGFDGQLVSLLGGDEYKKEFESKGAVILDDAALVDEIWRDRPKRSATKPFILDTEYAGISCAKKVRDVLREVRKNGANALILNDLCDIAYLLNLRASDIPNVPVFYSYLYLSRQESVLFCEKKAFTGKIQKYLKEEIPGIKIEPIDSVYTNLSNLKGRKVLADPASVNLAIAKSLEGCKIIRKKSPVALMRAVKNKTEIKNIKDAHLAEGLVLTRMIYELKTYANSRSKKELRESDVVKRLIALRKKEDGYICDSFGTIAAYGPNAAMMHYSPKPGEDSVIEKSGFLLIDTGGHFYGGTTDTTRTIAMGPLTDEQKHHYTLVLKGHLNLMAAVFPKGTCGENLDVLARTPLWNELKDYRSGTGHGVGYLLSVHEGPNAFRCRITSDTGPLKPGMVTTDEPGYYLPNHYGIRIENELLCEKYKESEYGTYYHFVPLTLTPYEPEAIDFDMLSEAEKETLKQYNRLVYKSLSPYLSEDERAWLKSVTSLRN